MTTGFTPAERAKAKNTRQAKVNARIGTITPAERQAIRDQIAAQREASTLTNVRVDTPVEPLPAPAPFCPIPATRALVIVEQQPEETPAPEWQPVLNLEYAGRTVRHLTVSGNLRRRLITHALHQQHLNNPPQHVCPEAQNTRRLLAARRPKPAPSSAPVRLFPPASLINSLTAYEMFSSLVRALDNAARSGNVEYADLLTGKIQRYAEPNSAAIWFRVNAFGSRLDIRHFVYDPDTNRLERYWERL